MTFQILHRVRPHIQPDWTVVGVYKSEDRAQLDFEMLRHMIANFPDNVTAEVKLVTVQEIDYAKKRRKKKKG